MDVTLVMFKADGTRLDFPIVREKSTIGRNKDCDFMIPLAIVSRRHCQLIKHGEKLFVRDLGSSNGTRVNKKRIQERELQAGDVLVVGPVKFTIVIDGEPAEIKPVKTILKDEEVEAVSTPQVEAGTVDVDASSSSISDAISLDGSGPIALEGEDEHEEDDTPLGNDPLAALEEMSKPKKK